MKNIFKIIAITVVCLLASSFLASAQKYGNGMGSYIYSVPANPTFDNQFTSVMETFATGKTIKISSKERVPADIVLVLDVSGSMEDGMPVGKTNSLDDLDKELGAIEGMFYFYYTPAFVEHRYPIRFKNNVWEYRTYYGGTWTPIIGSEYESQIINGSLTVYIQKINALRISVNKFLKVVYDDSMEKLHAKGQYHRVSIIKFASEYANCNSVGGDGTPTLVEGNNEEMTEVLKNFVNIETGMNDLCQAIADIDPEGATAADFGMALAEKEMLDLSRNGTQKSIVFFTDGEPNHSSGFSTTVANSTIAAAKILKADPYLCRIFSVGTFNTSSTENIQKYMNGVSSNYPYATSISSLGTRGEGDFYQTVDTSYELFNVFTEIGEDVVSGTALVSYDTESTSVNVKIADDFQLPEGTKASDIKVYTSKCTACPTYANLSTATWADFQFNDSGRTLLSSAVVTISDDKKTISVKGFDFQNNWVGRTGDNASDAVRSDAKKLIIEVPTEITPENEGGTMEIASCNITDCNPDVPVYDGGKICNETVNITVNVKGLNPGETILYEVKDKTTKKVVGTIVITNTTNSADTTVSKTLKTLPSSNYTLTPKWNLRSGLQTYDTSKLNKVCGTYTINVNLANSSATVPNGEDAVENKFYTTCK